MSGFLTRAESRALRMTAENGECALEFNSICTILTIATRSSYCYPVATFKALRGRDAAVRSTVKTIQ